MREIHMKTKELVIKLFLKGLSYDQIARETGVSKGGVVNIIDDYREGRVVLTGDMTEVVDELRRVAVDLRKNNATVSQVTSYVRIHAKLIEMGVDSQGLEQWLDICRDIASAASSGKQFASAALELARMESQTGMTYQKVINDYKSKLALSKELDEETEEKEEQLDETYLKHERQEKQAQDQLNSITQAIMTAQETFHKQKEDLKAQLEEYRAQNKLSWRKINTAVTLLGSELSKAHFTQKGIENLAEQIRNTGSLVIYIRRLENTRDELCQEIEQLKRTRDDYNPCVNSLKRSFDELTQNCRELHQSKSEVERRMGQLEAELESKRDELRTLILTICECQYNFYVTELIIGLLSSPKTLDDLKINQLAGLMIAIMQKRKGVGSVWKIDEPGNPVCECLVPEMFRNSVYLPGVNIEHVRELLATYLFPIVKDKFITRQAHELFVQKLKREHEKEIIHARYDMLQRLGRKQQPSK